MGWKVSRSRFHEVPPMPGVSALGTSRRSTKSAEMRRWLRRPRRKPRRSRRTGGFRGSLTVQKRFPTRSPSLEPMVPPGSAHEAWFQAEVLPHLPMLRAWLRSRYSDEADVKDVVQEAVIRILGARDKSVIESPKAFLFATARNLSIQWARKRLRHATLSLADLDELGVLDENEDVPQAIARSEELEFLTQAMQSLPTRCRQIVTLRKIYGMSQKRHRPGTGHFRKHGGKPGLDRHAQAHRVFRACRRPSSSRPWLIRNGILPRGVRSRRPSGSGGWTVVWPQRSRTPSSSG
ncbi:MAG: RNA polymerase sigma factor [Verrucomicrobia bacterium]|nr:RNA polymerase sigma factor [Verrucomicrobiota bacterium]